MGVGFFTPLPLAMMPIFMGAQSIIMGEAFGKGFQFGKRKISALTNEEFNKLSLAELWKDTSTDVSDMIPSLKAGMQESRELQSFIVRELIAVVKQLPKDVLEGAVGSPVQGIPSPITGGIVEPLIQIVQAILDKGITLNLAGAGNLLPSAFAQPGHDTAGAVGVPPPQTNLQTFVSLQPQGPQLPESGVQVEGQREKSQRLHEEKYDKIHKALNTDIANEVNNITKNFNPVRRRLSQSSQLSLSGQVKASSNAFRAAITLLGLVKLNYADLNHISIHFRLYRRKMAQYKNFQVNIAKHLKIYRL